MDSMGHGFHFAIWHTRPGELTFCYGKSPFFMGKSTIFMAIFNCYVAVHQRVTKGYPPGNLPISTDFRLRYPMTRIRAPGHQCNLRSSPGRSGGTGHVAWEEHVFLDISQWMGDLPTFLKGLIMTYCYNIPHDGSMNAIYIYIYGNMDPIKINLDPLLIKVPLIKRMPALGTIFFNCFSIPPIENQYYMSRE